MAALLLGLIAGHFLRPAPIAASNCENDVCGSLIGTPHSVCLPHLDESGTNCDGDWATVDGELVMVCDETEC